MRKKSFFILILAVAIVLTGCAPKVVGKRKHKKIRNCGCELVPAQNDSQNAENVCFCELRNESI